MKKWLSKALVLAMVVAMMVPVPVAAKSGSGSGKLVKSVTVFDYDSATGGWTQVSKSSYTYDSKNNPTEIRFVGDYTYFMGIPVGGSATITTASYKYKGKSPKSMSLKDTSGTVVEKRKYKKGKVVSAVGSNYIEDGYYDESADKWVDQVKQENYSNAFSYDKKGNVKAATYVNGTSVSNAGFVVKKGNPTLIASNTINSNGSSRQAYSAYNKKGLIGESGVINAAGQPTAKYVYEYTMKKGNVATAAVYEVKTDGTKVPSTVYKFEYTKTKISKSRYANMINALVGWDSVPNFWY